MKDFSKMDLFFIAAITLNFISSFYVTITVDQFSSENLAIFYLNMNVFLAITYNIFISKATRDRLMNTTRKRSKEDEDEGDEDQKKTSETKN